jgi:hypothetical protein
MESWEKKLRMEQFVSIYSREYQQQQIDFNRFFLRTLMGNWFRATSLELMKTMEDYYSEFGNM